MVKKAISGKGRGGAPPLPRQRGALRVVQITLAALGAFLFNLAYRSWMGSEVAQAVVLVAVALICVAWALWMGIATVRGPRPPSLD